MRYADGAEELMARGTRKRTRRPVKPSSNSPFGSPPDHVRRPSDEALRTLERIDEFEMRSSFLPVRRAFIQRRSASEPPPPLARLLPRAGLDAVQLKLFLLVLRIAAYGERSESPYEANVFAKALDLDDKRPGGTGDRRVRDAVRRLEEHKLLKSQRTGTRGARERLMPLREDGTGRPYTNPAGRQYPKRVLPEGDFFPLQDAFFTKGWICALSGAGVTTLLILLNVKQAVGDTEWVFVSPSQRRDRYGISHDTWLSGLAELAEHNLIMRQDRKTHVGPGPFDFSRQENVRLRSRRLNRQPERAFYMR